MSGAASGGQIRNGLFVILYLFIVMNNANLSHMPPEIIHDILAIVLSENLHRSLLQAHGVSLGNIEDNDTWNDTFLVSRVCRDFEDITISILLDILNIRNVPIGRSDPLSVFIEVLTALKASFSISPIERQDIQVLLQGSKENMIYVTSPYISAYRWYSFGINQGLESNHGFNPIVSAPKTWSVDPRQLSAGIRYLRLALSCSGNIVQVSMAIPIKQAIVTEICNQLIVRQFQVWRWCLVKAFHLLALSPSVDREFVDLSISRLLDRISGCEELTPMDMGYDYEKANLSPLPEWAILAMSELPKATSKNLDASQLHASMLQLWRWREDPDHDPPWRAKMSDLLEKWRDLTS